ncbi:MAG: hypothetical protein ACTHN5_19530 [Phycisphaerae bacterium]
MKIQKSSSVMIAVLTLTAIILGVILLAAPSRDAQAHMITNQTTLSMITTGVSGGGDEMLIIMDKNTGKMLAYRVNGNEFELVGSMDMNQLFTGMPAPTR